MTSKYNNVYLKTVSTVAGPLEKEGPLGELFDKTNFDYYFGKDTFEQAEMAMLSNSINILLQKASFTEKDIDLFISGDLMNQVTTSSYTAAKYDIPFLGIYNACASMVEGLIIGSSMIQNKFAKNCICSSTSHNLSAEKQYRNPIEYGAPRAKTTTYTVTGSGSALLSSEISKIKVESSTIGKVKDYGITNVFNMGAVMAPGAADVIARHLNDTKRKPEYYDLILTGDLGKYGKEILRELIKEQYAVKLGDNYNDSATMIYDLENQPVFAGGSGPACLPLVAYSYVIPKMLSGELKKVLLVATGALMSPTMINQKLSIPTVAHAISLEVVK